MENTIKTEIEDKPKSGYKLTKLGWIPEEWDILALEQIGDFSKGKGVSKAEIIDNGHPCITYGEIYTKHNDYIRKFDSFINDESAKASKEIIGGEILFAGSGETLDEIGKCVAYLEREKAYAGGDVIIFKPHSTDSLFLSYLLNSNYILRYRRKLGQGHSVVHIYSSGLKTLEIPVPSFPEQQKIAQILSTWDKAIEKTEQLIKTKTQLKKGLMHQLLTGKKRFREFEGEEWKEVLLGNIAKINTGGRDNQNKIEDGKYPFFVRSEKVERINSYSFDGEAILIPGEGKIGEIFHYINGKFDFHQRVYKISDFIKDIHGKFIYFYLKHFFIREAIRNSVKATVDSLRLPVFLEMKIKLPKIEEQRRISKTLSAFDNELIIEEKRLKFLQLQKKGLMQKLLTGEARVKIDY